MMSNMVRLFCLASWLSKMSTEPYGRHSFYECSASARSHYDRHVSRGQRDLQFVE